MAPATAKKPLHLPANPASYAGCLIVRWRETKLLNVNGLFNKDCKTSNAMKHFGSEMYEKRVGNFCGSVVVDFSVTVVAIIPGFSKKLPLLKCI